MPSKKKDQQTIQGEETTPDWTPPTDEELTGGAPPPSDPKPADPLKQVLDEYGYKDVDQLRGTINKTRDLQNKVETLERRAKEDAEIHDKIDDMKKQVDQQKLEVMYAEQAKTLKSLTGGSSPAELAFLLEAIKGKGDDGTKGELAAIRQQLVVVEKERAQADMKHSQEIADMKHSQERAEDKRAQEIAEMKRVHDQEVAEMKHAQERAEDKRAQELAEQRHAQELATLQGGLMQQISAMQARVDAAGSRLPGALGAIGEIKALITDANNLKVALKDLGLTGAEGGKDSLAGAVVDKLLGSVMKLAKSAGVEDWLQGATGQGQQAAGPPPAPEDRPPTQDEFDQASVEWFRLHGSTVKPGQIKMTDDGFLIGNGPEIQTYINSNPRTTGVQPCISKEGLYMVPPTMSKAYLDWVRNVTAQAQGGAGAPPTKKGDSNVRTGF
jgi:hypothetical protein